ncbi:MAG: hypothetical protein GKR91_07550 [Pseudomonadales bacterium]|nr:hypothetical protein [Pseudomonadales bacterium]
MRNSLFHNRIHSLGRCLVLLSMVLGITWVSEVSAQSILRLFSTPAERAELELQRLRLNRPDLVEEVSELPLQFIELPTLFEEEEIVEIVYRLGGTMFRNDGRYTVWLNNEAIYQEDLPGNMELLEPYTQGQLRITNEESGVFYDVKPGQVLNFTTGVLLESYEYVPPPPAIDAAEEGETTAAPMVETVEPIDLSGPDTAEAAAAEVNSPATANTPGVIVNANQLVDQARDLQDPIQ